MDLIPFTCYRTPTTQHPIGIEGGYTPFSRIPLVSEISDTFFSLVCSCILIIIELINLMLVEGCANKAFL